MPNNLVFKKDNIIDFKGYDNKTNTLVIKDVKELTKKELDDLFKREVIGFILLAISFSIMFVFYKDIFNIRRNNYYNQALNKILKE